MMRIAQVIDNVIVNVIKYKELDIGEELPSGYVACPDGLGIGNLIDDTPVNPAIIALEKRRAKIDEYLDDEIKGALVDAILEGATTRAQVRANAKAKIV